MEATQHPALRTAQPADAPRIWEILQKAIERRRLDGSKQWQDGYPNPETIQEDLHNNYGHVIESNGAIVAYAALITDPEPAYEAIEGSWLTDMPYLVIHRVAIANEAQGKGVVKWLFVQLEDFCRQHQLPSIRVDTNFDNAPMLAILEKLGYQYCGEVYLRGGARKAFEKVV